MKNSTLTLSFFITAIALSSTALARDLDMNQIPAMFSFLDANQDGYLDYNEVKRVDATLTTSDFLSIDLDGDELVTLDEYIAHLENVRGR